MKNYSYRNFFEKRLGSTAIGTIVFLAAYGFVALFTQILALLEAI